MYALPDRKQVITRTQKMTFSLSNRFDEGRGGGRYPAVYQHGIANKSTLAILVPECRAQPVVNIRADVPEN